MWTLREVTMQTTCPCARHLQLQLDKQKVFYLLPRSELSALFRPSLSTCPLSQPGKQPGKGRQEEGAGGHLSSLRSPALKDPKIQALPLWNQLRN